MYCSYCGKEVKNAYCSHCGAKAESGDISADLHDNPPFKLQILTAADSDSKDSFFVLFKIMNTATHSISLHFDRVFVIVSNGKRVRMLRWLEEFNLPKFTLDENCDKTGGSVFTNIATGGLGCLEGIGFVVIDETTDIAYTYIITKKETDWTQYKCKGIDIPDPFDWIGTAWEVDPATGEGHATGLSYKCL